MQSLEFLNNLCDELISQSNRGTHDVGFMVCYKTRSGVIKLIDKPGVFLTAKACDKHIENNDYHYPKGASSFGINFWRNPEMIQLINAIFDITKKELPSWYTKL